MRYIGEHEKKTFLIYASTTPNGKFSGVSKHVGELAVMMINPDLKFGGYSTAQDDWQ